MKVFFRLASFLFFLLSPVDVFSQVIWFENFESYTEGTGYQSSVSDDLIESVSKWDIDVSNLDLSVSNSHFKVTNISSNKLFEAQKVNQEVIMILCYYLNVKIYVMFSMISLSIKGF